MNVVLDEGHPGQKSLSGSIAPFAIVLAVDGERSDEKLMMVDWPPLPSIVTFFTIRLSVWGHKIGSNMQFDAL